MFEIEYKGGNALTVSTKKVSLAIDPKVSLVGLKDLLVKEGVQLATEERFTADRGVYRLTIDSPGEYEVADVAIRGIAAQRHIDTEEVSPAATVYQLEIGGVRVAVLGNIAPKLSDDQLEAIGVVDIVALPVGGGGYTLDATSAAALVRQIDPKAVIPVHYADAGLSYEVPQEALEVFTAELGAPVESAGGKYKVKSAAGLPEALTVITVDRT